jgi:hypothetical protein
VTRAHSTPNAEAAERALRSALETAAGDAAALAGMGVDRDALRACLPAGPCLTPAQLAALAAEHRDVAIFGAWLLEVPLEALQDFLQQHWAAGAGERTRTRILALRHSHQRLAAAAKSRKAACTQPDEVVRRVDEMIASGRARSRNQARQKLAQELRKSPEYLRRQESKGRRALAAADGGA